MLEYKKSKIGFKHVIYSKPFLVFLFVMTLLLGKAAYNVYQKEKLSKESFALASTRLVELTDREKYLSGEIKRLQKKEGVDEEIRDKFRVAKDGETTVFIVEPNNEASSTQVNVKESLWQRFTGFFKR